MKHFLAFFLSVITLVSVFSSSCFAEDLSSKSENELLLTYNAIRNELLSRGFATENKKVIFEDDNIQIYLNGNITVDNNWMGLRLEIPVVVINKSSLNYTVQLRDSSVNGWSCETWVSCDNTDSKKAKDSLSFELKDTDVESIEDFEDVEFKIHYFESGNFFGNDIDSDALTLLAG